MSPQLLLTTLMIFLQRLEIECIRGGEQASTTDFIFRAQLVEGPFCNWKHTKCGGTLISTSHVLTAAHCIRSMYVKKLKVVVGGIMQNGSDGIVYSVRRLLVHDDYRDYEFDYDIGIAVLAYEVQLIENRIGIAALPKEKIAYGSLVSTFGWGVGIVTNYGEEYEYIPEVMKKMTGIKIYDQEYCLAHMPDADFDFDFNCMISNEIDGMTRGDSGGGIISDGDIVIGVYNLGIVYSRGRYPDLFTPVIDHLYWIRRVMHNCNATRCIL